MVCNGAYRNIGFIVLSVFLTRYFAYLVEYIPYCIDLEHIVDPLHYAGKALKSHSGIDILVLKLGICPVAHIVEL